MTGFSDAFKPRAPSPEEKRRWFGVVRRLADELQIPHDQLLPFREELLEIVRNFLSVRNPRLSQATLELAPEQLLKLHKAANTYVQTIMRMPRWLCSSVERALPKQFAAPPLGFVPPPSPSSDLLGIAERVLETASAALIVAEQSAKATKRKRGRQPKSQPEDRDFSASDALVWSVLNIAYRRGGTITVDKKHGGTLDRFFAAASKLDVWPPGCAPHGLTSARLYRLHRQWRAFHKADIE